MDFLQLAAERCSVRKFLPDPVKKQDMDAMLKAGCLAPTAHNSQPQRMIVCDTPEALAKVNRCTKCLYGAPAAILVCYDKSLCWQREYDGKSSGEVDASIVTTHMMLAAAAAGVGTTWVMYFDPEAVREEFKLPENLEPVAILIAGYPSPEAKPAPGHSQFRPMEDTVSYNGL